MALQSAGELVFSDSAPIFSRSFQNVPIGLSLINQFASYAAIYKKVVKVYAVVNKLAFNTARLPLKVYERDDTGREEARDHPYAELLRHPNRKFDPFFFWLWTASTYFIYGESLWLKIRDRSGDVRELWPLHPANIITHRDGDRVNYQIVTRPGTTPLLEFEDTEVVHFRAYSPDNAIRGVSPLEPLRMTLINEDAARRATTAFWSHGARPSIALKHPKELGPPARERLKLDFEALNAGVDNFGKIAILEEGMEAQVLSIAAEDAQYIETRKLNETEIFQAYDISPIAMHVLDHATYSNVTEAMRSVYRDSMAPKLRVFESVLDSQLRPDFDEDGDVYAEFLMDEVLRGAFEQRAESYQKAITSGWLEPAEARKLENLPFVEGSDQLFIQGAMRPLEAVAAETEPPVPQLPPGFMPPVDEQTDDESEPADATAARAWRQHEVNVVMGRLSRVEFLKDIDIERLTAGLNGTSARITLAYAQGMVEGESVSDFKRRLHEIVEG